MTEETELTSQQKLFVKGLQSVAGAHSLDEVRTLDWHFDGGYRASKRNPENTNYQRVQAKLFDNEGRSTTISSAEDDTTARRCSICHQPLEHVNLISINGQVVQMGSDCTAKLQRFLETGEIVSENPYKKIWEEQSDILLDGAQYERSILDKESEKINKNENYDEWRKSRIITKRKIIASMMTWLTDHMEDETMPEAVRYAVRSFNASGMAPSKKSAQIVNEYYKSTRKFLPDEILKDIHELTHHPHRQLLRKVLAEGIPQTDIPQLKRIIETGQRILEERHRRYREYTKEADPQQWPEKLYLTYRDQKQTPQIDPKAQATIREHAQILLERHYQAEGSPLNRAIFRRTKYATGIMMYLDSHELWQKNRVGRSYEEDAIPRSVEYADDGTIHVFELDQAPTYGFDIEEKFFVIIGDPEDKTVRLYPKAASSYIASQVNKRNIKFSIGAVNDTLIEDKTTDVSVKRYSCAQVIISQTTDTPVILLKHTSVPLEEFLKEYSVIEV